MSYELNVNVRHRRLEITSKNNPGNEMHLRGKGPPPFCLKPLSQSPKVSFTMSHCFNYCLTDDRVVDWRDGSAGKG